MKNNDWFDDAKNEPNEDTVTAEPIDEIWAASRPSYYEVQYKDMTAQLRVLFGLWTSIGWILRTSFFIGLAYLVTAWALPNQILDTPFSDWSLRMILGLLASGWAISFAFYWITNPPELRDYYTLASNQYSGWFTFAWNFLIFAALIWVFFCDGISTLKGVL